MKSEGRVKGMKKAAGNIYMPSAARIEEIIPQGGEAKLFRVRAGSPLHYRPGQFFMVSLWGAGEVPISVASLSRGDDVVEFCIRRAGFVTSAIHALAGGETLWLRGPYGVPFPTEPAEGRDVLIVAGGIGLAPLRPLVLHLSSTAAAGRTTVLYGARTPEDLIFTREMEQWRKRGVRTVLTVDRASEDWQGHTGVVTALWREADVDIAEACAYICGPEIMIEAAMRDLFGLGMPDDRIITTLEAHMKCGVGKCGHCYAGPRQICTDGPVFSYREIREQCLLQQRG